MLKGPQLATREDSGIGTKSSEMAGGQVRYTYVCVCVIFMYSLLNITHKLHFTVHIV